MIYHDFCDRRRRKPVEVVSEVADVPAFEQDVVDRRWMWAELSALSPRQRAVLVLRYYEGLPDEEIAAVLGCRRTTVRSLVARALQQLRERYDAAAPDASPATGQERTQP